MKNNTNFLGGIHIAVIIVILLLILFPFPDLALDILIALNILLALLILLYVLKAKKIKDFSLLPTVILCVILFNLSTIIAVTRAILVKGPEFNGLLVGFIASWASSGGISGVIISYSIFLCIFAVLIIVITKGMTRVSELAARFTLDSMSVKLMAIEAEFADNSNTEEEAAERKKLVQSEADFYGSLDGVSKFISGNLKIIILIIFITVAGGVLIGVMVRKEEFSEALITYMSLTTGSGIFAILHTFIISTAAGIAVTKFFK